MEKELFRTIIAESQEYIGRIHLVQRPLYLEEYGNYVFVGVRQAGKSYLLYQRIQQLLTNGVDIEDIVYVNFDDERLQGMSVADFDFILQAYYSMYEGQPIFFFDVRLCANETRTTESAFVLLCSKFCRSNNS